MEAPSAKQEGGRDDLMRGRAFGVQSVQFFGAQALRDLPLTDAEWLGFGAVDVTGGNRGDGQSVVRHRPIGHDVPQAGLLHQARVAGSMTRCQRRARMRSCQGVSWRGRLVVLGARVGRADGDEGGHVIYVDAQLAWNLANSVKSEQTGCLEYSRYTGDDKGDGTVLVYAWVNNVARKIGIMSRDGKHALTKVGPLHWHGACSCGNWTAPPGNGPNDQTAKVFAWRRHAL